MSNEEQPSSFKLVLNIFDIISLIIQILDDGKMSSIC